VDLIADEASNPGIPATPAVAIIFLVGLVIALVSITVRPNAVLFTVLLGTGTALLAASAVVAFERLVPPWTQRVQLLRTHFDIYVEFEKMLGGLRGNSPHVIRTINSFLPQTDTEHRWDTFATSYLTTHPDTTFIRVVSADKTEAWRERLSRIESRYAKLSNYRQHTVQKGAVPPIEMFLVDGKEVLLSFGTPASPQPPVTFGIKLRDPQVCQQLEAYHRIQLESKFKRDEAAQATLDQQKEP
jgi:hypothetical protein